MSDTKKYEVVNPLAHKGTRFERGDELDLTEDEARNYGELVKEKDAGEAGESAPENAEGENTDGGENDEGEGTSEAGESSPEGEGENAGGNEGGEAAPEGEGEKQE